MAHLSRIVHSARLVDGGGAVDDAWVRIEAGRVAAIGTGGDWRYERADEIIDATAVAGAGALLTPGFIDLHGHGGGGLAYDDGAEQIVAAREVHRAHGTTRAVVSLVTAALPDLIHRLGVVAELARTDDTILGSHLEGPFLDPEHHGAHDPALLLAPDAATVDLLLSAGAGTVRQVTIAPELDGGLEAIPRIVAAGAVAAVGHTAADEDAARRAYDAGATLLTHAFNAMPGLHHRDPGPVGAATADPRVTLEIIADGVHLHPEIVRLAFAAAPGRVALVTDAMAAAGAPDGDYVLGALPVHVAQGIALLGDGTIAGSTLTQDAALRTAVDAGVPVAEAVAALTATPARVLGRRDLGSLGVGAVADAVLLDDDLTVHRVWTGRV